MGRSQADSGVAQVGQELRLRCSLCPSQSLLGLTGKTDLINAGVWSDLRAERGSTLRTWTAAGAGLTLPSCAFCVSRVLESEEGRREYLAFPSSKSPGGGQKGRKELLKGNGRRIDYMLHGEEGLCPDWKAVSLGWAGLGIGDPSPAPLGSTELSSGNGTCPSRRPLGPMDPPTPLPSGRSGPGLSFTGCPLGLTGMFLLPPPRRWKNSVSSPSCRA